MAVTYSSVNSAIIPALQTADTSLQNQLNAIAQKSDPTPEDLMALQVGEQEWSLVSQVGSSVYKDIGDTLKGIIDKAS